MPADLLHAVAVAHLVRLPGARITFADGADMDVGGCRWLGFMQYFEPWMSGDFDPATVIAPVDGADFTSVVRLLEHADDEPSHERLRRALEASDKLGLVEYKRTALRKTVFAAELFRICPDMWRASRAERRWCDAGASADEGFVVPVDAALAAGLRYGRLERAGDDRLLHQLPEPNIATGAALLHADPACALEDRLPVPVDRLLRQHAGKLVLAGGAVVGAVARHVAPGSDYDLFFVGVDEKEAGAIMDGIMCEYDGVAHLVRTNRAVTLLFNAHDYDSDSEYDDGDASDIVVQLIMRLHDSVGQVVVGFDHAPCKAAAFFDGEGYLVQAAPSWVPAMRHMAFSVDLSSWSASGCTRAYKYMRKGFDVLFPGGGPARSWLRPLSKPSTGVASLFVAEARITQARLYDRRGCRITECEVADIARSHHGSDYIDNLSLVGNVRYAVRAMVRAGVSWLSSAWRPARHNAPEDPPPYKWHRCDPANRCKAAFQPASAAVGEAFDVRALTDAILQRLERVRVA
jgi:hypothetical protein